MADIRRMKATCMTIKRITIISQIVLFLAGADFMIGHVIATEKPFVIRVLDSETGLPVPLVEISTVNNIRKVTDNQGVTAWPETDLNGEDVFFQLKSHGYEFAKDGFGYAGQRIKVKSGGSVDLKIKRVQLAQRLYRITGAGRLAESQLAGLVSIHHPDAITKSKVIGQDSVQMTEYKKQLHWMWGDTNRLAYPLGNFHMPKQALQPKPAECLAMVRHG
jgi:hypothetical protein